MVDPRPPPQPPLLGRVPAGPQRLDKGPPVFPMVRIALPLSLAVPVGQRLLEAPPPPNDPAPFTNHTRFWGQCSNTIVLCCVFDCTAS